MKFIKYIITVAVWVLVGVTILIMIITHIPSVQSYIGTVAADFIAEQLGSKVSIGKVNIGLFNRVIIDDVMIYDRNSKEMMKSARMSVKIDIDELTEGRIRISSAQVFSTHFTLYKDSTNSAPNFQFIIDALSSKDTTSTSEPLDLAVNSFIMRHCSLKYDIHDKAATDDKIDVNHLNLSEISAYIQLDALKEDSVNAYVKKLSMQEKSGIKIDNISFNLVAGNSNSELSDFELLMPNSRIAISNITAKYEKAATDRDSIAGWDKIIPESVTYSGDIEKSNITLADISPLLPNLKTFKSTIGLQVNFSGTSNSLNVAKLKVESTTGDIDIDASGNIRNWKKNPIWNVNIREFSASAQSVEFLTRNFEGRNFKAPAILKRLGDIRLRGTALQTHNGNIHAKGKLTTSVGYVDLNITAKNRYLSGNIHTSNIDLKSLTANEDLGLIAADINIRGSLPKHGTPTVFAEGMMNKFTYKGYEYSKMKINGSYAGGTISGNIAIDDPNIQLVAEGTYLSQKKDKTVKLKAAISEFCPSGIKLTDKWGEARFGATITADFKASGVNDSEGTLEINDFAMTSPKDTFLIDNVSLESGFEDEQHYLQMTSDFGYAELKGKFNYSTLTKSFTNLIGSRLPTLPGLPEKTKTNDNDFTIVADISNTEGLEALLNIPLELKEPLTIRGNVEDINELMTLECEMPRFIYDGVEYENALLDLTSPDDSLKCEIQMMRAEKNDRRSYIKALLSAVDNNLITSVEWYSDADDDKIIGNINAHSTFFSDEENNNVAQITVDPSKMMIGDKTWDIAPASITYKKKRIEVDGLSISHDKQFVNINGIASDDINDSLKIALNGIDVEYVLDMVNFHSVDFSGSAYGNAYVIAPFGEMSAYGLLTVRSFEFEHGDFGTLTANVNWNTEEKQIDISGVTDDGEKHITHIDGYISPSRSYIDLDFKASETKIDFLHSFTNSFLGDIRGNATGNLKLSGPLSDMNLTGKVAVNGNALVGPTNCRYYLKGDTVYFGYNEIKFVNTTIYDTNQNKGVVNGSLYHDHLSDLSYSIKVDANNLLAYDFKNLGDDSFCGTIFGSGSVTIDGKSGELKMNIDIEPKRNSKFIYNIASAEEISDQAFIQWNDVTTKKKIEDEEKTVKTIDYDDYEFEMPSETHINFLIRCNPSATIEVIMDSRNNDRITLVGNGNIRASYYNKGSFQMFGTYRLTHGTYVITIQDIIEKKFTFSEGGTIVFGGNPFAAALNMEAKYTVNNVSLSDLNIGSSFTSQTNVDCIMKIGGEAKSPQVTFDLDFPKIGTDEKNAIKTIIDGEDEKNQQVIYLLAIGRFYPQENNNSSTQNTSSNQSEPSLAMQSILSGTISSQLSSVLNTVINNNNWNIGANISTGNEGWNNAEYEGIINGRLLNNRLLINGQFGYRENATTANTNFIGDFDIQYLLIPNGNLALKVYNETNDRYFTKSSLNTQGIGIIMRKDFNNIWDLVGLKRKKENDTDTEKKNDSKTK